MTFQTKDGKKALVAFVSVVSNTLLVVGKLIVGLLIGSVSIISEAIHSGVDLVAAIMAFASVRASAKPADKGHAFGHGKIENVSGAIEALLIFVAAGWILYEAVRKLIVPCELKEVGIGVLVMLVSAIANQVVSHFLFKVGNETDSIALKADAWHLRTDVYTSLGVMTGLGAIWTAKQLSLGWDLGWVDPVAAIFVAILILKVAWQLTSESVKDLLDSRLPENEEEWIRRVVRGFAPRVHGMHGLRTRKAGGIRFVEFHLIVEQSMSVAESHEITEMIDTAITMRYEGAHVTAHVEPCAGDCSAECIGGCILPAPKRKRNV